MRRARKFLVVNPPTGLYRRDDRCQSRVEDQTIEVVFAPIDLALYAAVLRRGGAEVRLRDYPGLRLGGAEFAQDLAAFAPDALVFRTTLATLEADLAACARAKEAVPGLATIGVGEALAQAREAVLSQRRELDVVIAGEPEPTLEALAGAADWSRVPGLSLRQGADESGAGCQPAWYESGAGCQPAQRVFSTPARPLLADLDILPYPARDLLENSRYVSPETGRPLTVIHAHRGCPSKCVFCPAGALSHYRVRFRSPENVFGEIESCVREFGIRDFLFHGDTFTINKRWLIELCRRIVEARLDIRWGCNSRVDTMDDERAVWLAKAGCWVVAFGVESGSQELLDRMKKGARVEQAREAVAICKRHGLRTHAFYIIGLPWESEATLGETFRLARALDTDFFDFNIAYPLPGTEYYEIARAEGLLDEPALAQASYAHAAARTLHLSREALERWRRRALLRLYLRPRYVARTLVRSGSPRVALRYVRAAVRRLRNLVSVR